MNHQNEVIVCAGPPSCPFEGDAAVKNAQDGCPKCRHIIISDDGTETEYKIDYSAIEALEQTALAAVAHVAYANYDHRERAANRAIRLSAQTGKYINPDSIEVC